MEPMCILERLPDTCLLAVFNFLQTSDLINVSLTCRKLYHFLYSTRSTFKVLDFRCFEEKMTAIPSKGIWANVTYVKYLSLRFCVKVRDFSLLKLMTRLERLDLFCTNVTDKDLHQVIPYKLIGIDLGYCELLTSSQVLKEFLLQRCCLKMIGFAALDQVVNDEVSVGRVQYYYMLDKESAKTSEQRGQFRLDLVVYMVINDFIFQVLDSLSNHDLKYLDISECNNITSYQVSNLLAKQRNVEQLSLQGTCDMTEICQVFETQRQTLTKLR